MMKKLEEMMMSKFIRQNNIFDPINQRLKIKVFGVGTLGSFITFCLAKCGFKDIEVYDFDKVEEHNIPNQLYRPEDIGMLKVDSLKSIIKQFTGIEIVTKNVKIDKDTILDFDLNTVFIVAFDTLEARKIVYEKLKEFSVVLIDSRLGGEEYNIQCIDLSNEKERLIYEKSLDIKPTNLLCGFQSILYSSFSVASEVCNLVKKINNEEDHVKVIKRHMKRYLILSH